MDGKKAFYFNAQESFQLATLHKTPFANKYSIHSHSSNETICGSINVKSAIKSNSLIVFTQSEQVTTVDLRLYVNLFYNNTCRRDSIVDSFDHIDAKHKSQFINAPSMQQDTIGLYLNDSICIVSQNIDNAAQLSQSKILIKKGDIKQCSNIWYIIEKVSIQTANAPSYSIQARKIVSLHIFINSVLKNKLKLPRSTNAATVLKEAIKSCHNA